MKNLINGLPILGFQHNYPMGTAVVPIPTQPIAADGLKLPKHALFYPKGIDAFDSAVASIDAGQAWLRNSEYVRDSQPQLCTIVADLGCDKVTHVRMVAIDGEPNEKDIAWNRAVPLSHCRTPRHPDFVMAALCEDGIRGMQNKPGKFTGIKSWSVDHKGSHIEAEIVANKKGPFANIGTATAKWGCISGDLDYAIETSDNFPWLLLLSLLEATWGHRIYPNERSFEQAPALPATPVAPTSETLAGQLHALFTGGGVVQEGMLVEYSDPGGFGKTTALWLSESKISPIAMFVSPVDGTPHEILNEVIRIVRGMNGFRAALYRDPDGNNYAVHFMAELSTVWALDPLPIGPVRLCELSRRSDQLLKLRLIHDVNFQQFARPARRIWIRSVDADELTTAMAVDGLESEAEGTLEDCCFYDFGTAWELETMTDLLDSRKVQWQVTDDNVGPDPDQW